MMWKLIILVLLASCDGQPITSPDRFLIVDQDKTGYMDRTGKILIPAVFENGHSFAEGLAAVRKGGMYGFIDTTGVFVIPPQYDMAGDFMRGIAVVYKNGQPYFINRGNQVVLDSCYTALAFCGEGKAIVKTSSGHAGLIDIASRKLIIDTLYAAINHFTNGVAVVYEMQNSKKNNQRVGVIDSTGNMLVPFGRYTTITDFSAGMASVQLRDPGNREGDADGVIDEKGNLLFRKKYQGQDYIDGGFHEGLAVRQINDHPCYVDSRLQILFTDTTYQDLGAFSEHRAFVSKDGHYSALMDNHFRLLTPFIFQQVQQDRFDEGYAVVLTGNGWGIIDASGTFVVKDKYASIEQVAVKDSLFFFREDDQYGIANFHGDTIMQPIMQYFDRTGFTDGLLKAVANGKLVWINKKGAIVWKQKGDTAGTLKNLDIDYMNRGYCTAYSSMIDEKTKGFGGWGTSRNLPQSISASGNFESNALSVKIISASADTFARQYKGQAMYVANSTLFPIRFNAQDSLLYLKLQAKDSQGNWRDIEYLPSSWCGNSYHTLLLVSGQYWRFSIPAYQGSLQTFVRASLAYIDPTDPKKEKILYSNAISAGINPAQFWNKQAYTPVGIMDPYNE